MYFLNTRSLPVGGGVGPLKVLDEANAVHPASDVVSAVRGHDVLMVTHGFNVNQMDGLQKLSVRWHALAGRRPMDSRGGLPGGGQ
jgi:hypothetical protein